MTQMTYLELVNRSRQLCGVTGSDLTTLSGISGESLRFKNWVNQAWTDIQEKHTDWNWLRTSIGFTTTDGQATYSSTQVATATTSGGWGTGSLGHWKTDSFRTYITSTGYSSEVFLSEIPYNDWRDMYQFGSLRTVRTRPVTVAIAPDRSVCLGPSPDSTGYTVVGEFFLAPSLLSGDTDVPALPERFQMAIVYRTMLYYGWYESAGEVIQGSQAEFNKIMNRLEEDQQPQVMVGTSIV